MTYAGGNLDGFDLTFPSPGSPPGMSSSKSSKASSLRSLNSDEDDSVTADVGHFEEIGLEDDAVSIDSSYLRDTQVKSNPNPYSATFTADLRAASARHVGPKIHPNGRDLARLRPQRDITSITKTRPPAPSSLGTQFRDASTRGLGIGSGPEPQLGPQPVRGLSARSASSANATRRRRSLSPSLPHRSLSPLDPNAVAKPQRSSSHSRRDPKLTLDFGKNSENDDDDDDNIPDGLILDNVPPSPRPPTERSASRASSAATSPERQPRERIRSVGNGTPPVAVHHGSLRSPSWKSDYAIDSPSYRASSPNTGRAKSWTAAVSTLSAEAKALTEKLEEHADELDRHGVRHSTCDRPNMKPRVKSALAELPPLRRTNIMIDPLPVSKEKEAVLSRTRPSWLPPKNPAEEKKHVKQYQKMMASSIEAEKKREADRKEKEESKDKAANALNHVWDGILKRWDSAIREQRTRELWWGGIAPRCRGAVWLRAIGNELGLTEASFNAALARSREVEKRSEQGKASTEDDRRMAWFTLIRTDVEQRAWVDLKIFQSGAPLHQGLVDVLRAYAMYRSDIGYVTGSHTIAALLLLNLDTPAAAFIALANVLNRPLPLSFYASDLGGQASACSLVHRALAVKSPQLDRHLRTPDIGLGSDWYLGDIFTTVFSGHLCLDECTRLWDVYVFEGDNVLVRAAVALLLDREMPLLGASTATEVQNIIENRSSVVAQGGDDQWMARLRDAGQR
ncbi:Uu.00g036740.m01.CDS01 [Anthostomella pinea]|uniref:Uu.00g036740.m01.CDS01 n=1 Tax=Anthostomella pinea TaxID=933095 RepID=A0AAI8YDH5_9PEZI|nr:Uu.00g036740.m01.CDS01 [Anthostomella pinea]